MREYPGSVVLISGGLGDIGLAIAQAYLSQGATVLLADRLGSELAGSKLQNLSFDSDRAVYFQIDVSDPAQVKDWVDQVVQLYGKIDISIVNAAQVTLKKIQDLSASEWQQEQRVNVDGAFFLAQASARVFVEKKIAGNIVFLGSWAAHAVHPNLPAYSVSKAAIRMLCQCMALEYASYGIRVNEIAPGYVNAGLSKVVWQQSPEQQEIAKEIVPVKQIIEPMDIAKQVLWITSTSNTHMTGSTVLIDGGLSLIRP